jgi:hypothetical protein
MSVGLFHAHVAPGWARTLGASRDIPMPKQPEDRTGALEVRPILIGPKNAELMTGLSWRWWRDHAAELGLEIIRVDGKPTIIADRALAAIEKRSTHVERVEEQDDVDELAAMRRRVARAG